MRPLPEHPLLGSGQSPPSLQSSRIPGGDSRTWQLRAAQVAAPMGPKAPKGARPFGMVLAQGYGCNVWDVDRNRYVDLAAGFGSMLLGHSHPNVVRALQLQSERLMQAMGDLYPSDAKIGLLRRLAELMPGEDNQVILGLSGADAVSAALKTASLATGSSKVLAFEGAYHGLSYGPLAACGLRESYRQPFQAQLNPHVNFLPYPQTEQELSAVERALSVEQYSAVLIEPILGRGGVCPMSKTVLQGLQRLTRDYGALLVADEIWTGLGRSGAWLYTEQNGVRPDIVCLGKGLGGGVPISATLASAAVMSHWSREAEVVHTSTFTGAPLACASALATLDVLKRQQLVERAQVLGQDWKSLLQDQLRVLDVEVRGEGLMLAVDLGPHQGAASALMQDLLMQGYVVSTGGGARQVLVFTPPLIIESALLEQFVPTLRQVIESWRATIRSRG